MAGPNTRVETSELGSVRIERLYASGLAIECNVRYRRSISCAGISSRVHSRSTCRWCERSTLRSYLRHLASAGRILVQVAAQNVSAGTEAAWGGGAAPRYTWRMATDL
jgi:hypothetical protein